MNDTHRGPIAGRPATYQIRVQGRLDESWSDWLEGMKVTYTGGDEGWPVTTLTGAVMDQAALHGVLSRLGNLNLTLISVRRIEGNAKGES